MVKNTNNRYSCIPTSQNIIKSRASNVAVHFKNTVETAREINGMTIASAQRYLKNVLAHKECVPFKRFKGGIGKCAQAKQFKTVIGRWPTKSVKCLLDLLKNAISNCEYAGKAPEDYYIAHIQVNKAQVTQRRTYRAHGRINPYIRHSSHVQMILVEKTED